MVGQTRYYNLDVQEAADPSRVMSREQYEAMKFVQFSTATAVSPVNPVDPLTEVFCFGEQVRYLSRSTGQWIPAVVQGHVMIGQELHYHLDIQESAHPSRVKREAGQAAQATQATQAQYPQYPPSAMAPTVPALPEVPAPPAPAPASAPAPAPEPQVPCTAASVNSRPVPAPLEDSVCALRVASPAPRAKAISVPQSRQRESILGATKAPDKTTKTSCEMQDGLKEPEIVKGGPGGLERVERPSDLFSQKTFLDEPHFGLARETFPDSPDSLSLNVSIPLIPVAPQTQHRVEQVEGAARPPVLVQPVQPVQQVQRLSDLFSQKTFLDEPHFGVSTTCDSLVEDSIPVNKKKLLSCSNLQGQHVSR